MGTRICFLTKEHWTHSHKLPANTVKDVKNEKMLNLGGGRDLPVVDVMWGDKLRNVNHNNFF